MFYEILSTRVISAYIHKLVFEFLATATLHFNDADFLPPVNLEFTGERKALTAVWAFDHEISPQPQPELICCR